jgi:hypothetical protein
MTSVTYALKVSIRDLGGPAETLLIPLDNLRVLATLKLFCAFFFPRLILRSLAIYIYGEAFCKPCYSTAYLFSTRKRHHVNDHADAARRSTQHNIQRARASYIIVQRQRTLDCAIS